MTPLTEVIESGRVTEFCGQSSSGKTQLCLQLTKDYLAHNENKRVLYVCMDDKFPVARLHDICLQSLDLMDRVLVRESCFYLEMLDHLLYQLPSLC